MKLILSVITTLLLCSLLSSFSFADTGIKGSIKNVKGESLSFASIIIKGQNKGTMANEDGLYELALPSGTYTVDFQYLSHKSLEKIEQEVDNNQFFRINRKFIINKKYIHTVKNNSRIELSLKNAELFYYEVSISKSRAFIQWFSV